MQRRHDAGLDIHVGVVFLVVDRRAAARYGINASEVLDAVASVGGRQVGIVFEGRWMPVPDGLSRTSLATPRASVLSLPDHEHHEHGCACEMAAVMSRHVPAVS